ncbi:MAG: hypothetical protein KIT34_19070 [Cyanobacteria bacterium TGS_CYA1]|nr:hypothetical protein [Cyanobacteria bacterium TGS_CYA1]
MKFRQVPPEGLDGCGVASPWGYILSTPEKLSLRYNITFESTYDDLDYCEEAILETDSGQLFMLKHYARAQGPKHTNIFGNVRIKNPIQEWNEIVEVLELTKEEVIAVHPAILESPEWD